MHHMLKEIYEQPAALKETLEKAPKEIEDVYKRLAFKPRTIYLVGSGSSYYCGRVFSYLYEFLTKKKAISCYSLEFAKYTKDIVTTDDLVFLLSQSGETTDAVQAARASKTTKIAITNAFDTTLEKMTQFTIHSYAGLEKSIPSTKSFTSMLAVLALLALPLTKAKLKKKLFEIPDLLKQSLDNNAEACKSIGNHFVNENIVDIVGEGVNYPVTLEGALKMKETAHMHAQGMPVGEYWHGHISLVKDGYPVILSCPGNEKKESTKRFMKKLSRVRAYAPIISFENLIKQLIDEAPLLCLPITEAILSPFLSVPMFQLIAYYSSIAKGLDPDKPVGLHKVVK
ncbi:MAG TPA: SIS domain-containing protein [Thermoplasmata archaeon]|nr:SIS domain-containing protein [Thermoplasmata archaeon]